MGGAISVPGNQTKWAEFNFYQDPKAAEYVFKNIKNIKLVSLDVTQNTLVYKEDLLNLNNSSISVFFKQAVLNWYNYFGKTNNRSFELYDPLAISVLLDNFISFREDKFRIITHGERKGALVRGDDFNINYSIKVKQDEFKKYFLSIFK